MGPVATSLGDGVGEVVHFVSGVSKRVITRCHEFVRHLGMGETILFYGLLWCLPMLPCDSMEFELVAIGVVLHLPRRSSA